MCFLLDNRCSDTELDNLSIFVTYTVSHRRRVSKTGSDEITNMLSGANCFFVLMPIAFCPINPTVNKIRNDIGVYSPNFRLAVIKALNG